MALLFQLRATYFDNRLPAELELSNIILPSGGDPMILSNEYVGIKTESERSFSIVIPSGDALGETVGKVSLSDSAEIYFEVRPAQRQKHYASGALYLLIPYLHEKLHEPIIHAVIDRSNEMAIHVVEHNGFEIISKDDDNVYYEHRIRETRRDDCYQPAPGQMVLYLAGGCFWGVERAFQELNGVTDTVVGYANGHVANPTYEMVCRLETGFRECIRVTYDPKFTSTETILKAYFICVDPTQEDGQGNDIGEQYRLGIYYKDPALEKAVADYLELERKKYPEFHVESKTLECFYEAEEYHQDYLLKNPSGYCHVTRVEMDRIRALNV